MVLFPYQALSDGMLVFGRRVPSSVDSDDDTSDTHDDTGNYSDNDSSDDDDDDDNNNNSQVSFNQFSIIRLFH